ncbi:hypothetical protein OHAE_1699 [Ochrobactrum soli]|uniref:Uncharacterized protein n=1 Tax=Ochrobactrum soli TaxID=2448455 RepID=A0A2P9HP10_9HYPH|nr:hypothetical protein OHAE_1699 [[Ochrobactrum] soli]
MGFLCPFIHMFATADIHRRSSPNLIDGTQDASGTLWLRTPISMCL